MRLDRPSPLSSISSSSGTAAANGGASSAPPLPARDAAEWASLVRKMQARNTALQEKLAAEVDLVISLRTDNALLVDRVRALMAERDAMSRRLASAELTPTGGHTEL